MPIPPARHARRAPTRAIHAPVSNMATIEPRARASSAIDNAPGLSANLSRTVGTWTPHDAYNMPVIKNTAIDEYRARFSLAAGRRRWTARGLWSSPLLPAEIESDTNYSLVGALLDADIRLVRHWLAPIRQIMRGFGFYRSRS